MDYKKDCEERLRRYAKVDETLEILNDRLERVKMNGKPSNVKAIDFQKIGHCTMTTDALNDLVEANHILNQINKLNSDKEIIKKVLNKIKYNNSEDYTFIEYRYLKDLPMNIVSEKLGYSDNSSRTIYKIRERALKNFIMYYWG